jgi:hypothetical protein
MGFPTNETENLMVHDNHVSPRDARPASVDRAEQRAWIGFYERVDRDPALAIEIMALLDTDADSKRRHLALYLSCRQSVRVLKARQARDRRIGELTQSLFRSLVLQPLAITRRLVARAADLLAACAPAGNAAARPPGRAATRAAEPTSDSAGRNVQRPLRGSAQPDRDGPSEQPVHADPERNPMVTEGPTPTVSLRR